MAEERAEAAEARLREFEQHEAETHASLGAILGTDTSLLDGAKRMQARLRAVIEAANQLEERATAFIENCWGDREALLLKATSNYRRVRDAQASPAERKYEWFLGGVDRELLQKLVAQGVLKHATTEPEASKQAGHAFHSGLDDTSMTCIHCGLPWERHGGRDGA